MEKCCVENTFHSEVLSVGRPRVIWVRKHNEPFWIPGEIEPDSISYYLAGLIEGDSHFNTPNRFTISFGATRVRVATIEVVFNKKDRPSTEFLQSLFGGKIYDHPNKKVIRWLIQDDKSVTKIINSINGKLRTPKINSLYQMIDFFNAKGDNIIKLPIDSSPLGSNAWLAGFIDAVGYFSIKAFTLKTCPYLRTQFYIGQPITDKNGKSLEKPMLSIAEFLQTKLNKRVSYKKFHQLVINISNPHSYMILMDYLNSYSLLSSKYLDFKDWETVCHMHTSDLHKWPKIYEEILYTIANMNENRTRFSWDHIEWSGYQ